MPHTALFALVSRREISRAVALPIPSHRFRLGFTLEGLLDRMVVWFKRDGELSPSELGATLCRVFVEGAQDRSAYRQQG